MNLIRKNEKDTFGKVICPLDLNKYHEFKTEAEATRWGYGLYEEWSKKHKARYERVVKAYKGFSFMPDIWEPASRYYGAGYFRINEYLRTGNNVYDMGYLLHYTIDLTISIFSTPRVEADIIVYRQVPEIMINELADCNRKGRPYVEQGFMSTSLLKNACINNCGEEKNILKIYVPGGFYALYANVIAERDEQELLFSPGTGVNLIKYPYNEGDKTIYEVMVIRLPE